MNPLIAIILDEGKWLAASMTIAFGAVILLFYRQQSMNLPARQRILAAMNLLFGIMIGGMAFGHLLAVGIKHFQGNLEGSATLFYLIGIVLAVPSGWIIYHTKRLLTLGESHGRQTLVLNGWLAITLLALGLHNLPLAAPGLFTMGYHLNSQRKLDWLIIGLALIVYVGLFIGSLIFLASGQSFEQFRGIE